MVGHWSSLLLLGSAFVSGVVASSHHLHAHEALHRRQTQGQNAKDRWNELHKQYLQNTRNSIEPDGQCTWDNMVVRREWGDMSVEDRKEFISALRCLKSKPGKTDQGEFPGARSRWDDIAVGHLINVMSVHRSPWLGVWHREYLWVLENALREECGYTGGACWHWSRYLGQDINTWPLFDNSEASISGNGTQTGDQCACVEEGPFANWTINLGPQGEGTWGCKRNPRPDGRGYNPSCIERTFNLDSINNNVRYEDVVYTIDQAPNANRFASLLELESPGVHNAPHLFMGGTQIDVTFSAQDPWFFFHHCMVDFVFALWQSVDFDQRTTSLPDSDIFNDIRSQGWGLPTPEVSLDSEIFISPVFGNITVREAMWPTKNKYCYRYE